MNPRIFVATLGALVFGAGPGLGSGPSARADDPVSLPPAAAGMVDFVAEIQPIFARRCVECHGPQKQKSGYRLDNQPIALRGGDSGHRAIVPGNSADSALLRLLATTDRDERMPPKGDPLSAAEIGLVRAWIEQGAKWPESASVRVDDPRDWWSLQPLRRPPVGVQSGPARPAAREQDPGARGRDAGAPAVEVNAVDALVRARLKSAGGKPSPEADRRTLIRRVTFDLTGLPPTPEEVQAFVSDPDPRAYERLVDRLLASPHYGERWARTWLDIVHYGDTHGYDKDKPRPNAWPYRDYVIRAFNEDKPYSRFVQEQLAGDVLFPDTADGIEALGFISAGPWDFIGHEEVPETKTDGQIARHLDRDDMVSNTIGTFASMTVHCAQCHDHKFDPIRQEDYYGLQAVFAGVDRTERRYYRESGLNRQRFERESAIRALTRQEIELREEVRRAGGEALKRADEDISKAEAAAKEGQPAEYGYHSAISAEADATKWVQVDLGQAVEVRGVALAPARDAFNNIGDGFGFPRRFRVEASADPEFKTSVVTLADHTGDDFRNPGIAPLHLPGPALPVRYVRVTATRLAPRQGDYIFALAELEVTDASGSNIARHASVTALDSIEAPPRWARQNLIDGKAPGAPSAARDLEQLRQARTRLVESAVPLEVRQKLEAVRGKLAAEKKLLEAMPKPLVAFVGNVHYGSGNFRGTGPDDGKPRPIFVLARGDVKRPGARVMPGALRCVSEVPASFRLPDEASEATRRAALAQWLTHPENPLTWRSIVNRIWQQRFGRGIVDTPNDFGKMGGRPSNPELLDWLAVEFRDGGQSFKTLDRLLVLSATYRQVSSAAGTSGALLEDADNRLLSRMNRRRLDAEGIRDSILAVSGKLDVTMYGPGFQDFVVEKPEHSPHYQYHLHDAEDPRTHRRSVYRFLVRSQQEPFMSALDCADPSMRVDRRNETLTPLQALALMNSNLAVAMARHLAERVEREVGAGTGAPEVLGARLDRAFMLATQRGPSAGEHSELVVYAERHGLSAACRLLLNLNEFVFVD